MGTRAKSPVKLLLLSSYENTVYKYKFLYECHILEMSMRSLLLVSLSKHPESCCVACEIFHTGHASAALLPTPFLRPSGLLLDGVLAFLIGEAMSVGGQVVAPTTS